MLKGFKNVFLALYVSFVLISCTDSSVKLPPKPEGYLPPDKMISVLADIHVAEAVVGLQNRVSGSPIKNFQKFEYKIFEKYNIDSTVYTNNYNYYASDLNLMRVIYKGVNDTLVARRKRKSLQ